MKYGEFTLFCISQENTKIIDFIHVFGYDPSFQSNLTIEIDNWTKIEKKLVF